MLIIYLERNLMRNMRKTRYPALEPPAAFGTSELLADASVGTVYIKPKRAAKPDMHCNRMCPLR
jgi:hypothetical protein